MIIHSGGELFNRTIKTTIFYKNFGEKFNEKFLTVCGRYYKIMYDTVFVFNIKKIYKVTKSKKRG